MIRTNCAIATALVLGISPTVGAGPHTISQSTSLVITPGNSISCSTGATSTAETSYYRAFHLADLDIAAPFSVSSVTVGIELANGGADGLQPLTIRLYDSADFGSLGTPVATLSTTIEDQSGSLVTFPIAGTIASGDLIVEILSPDGASTGDQFLMGSNSAGQTAPSYIRAPLCGLATPTDLAAVAAGHMNIVLTVTGVAPDGLTCETQLTQTDYTTGETVAAQRFQIANSAPSAAAVELKVWIGVPGRRPLSVANVGADGSFVLPAAFARDFGSFNLFEVTSTTPRGAYELGCRILEPTTGAALATSISSFFIH